MKQENQISILKKIMWIVVGPFTVLLASWIIFFFTEFFEKILWNQTVVSQDTESVTYDPILYIFWRIVHFLNGPILSPIINLFLILVAGVAIVRALDSRTEKLCFGIPFSLAYGLNILIGILGGYFKSI